jgi:hypothetical protein
MSEVVVHMEAAMQHRLASRANLRLVLPSRFAEMTAEIRRTPPIHLLVLLAV